MKEKSNRFSNEFLESIKYSSSHNLYLGVGNPESNILIIGKETSSDHITFNEMGASNLNSWKNIIDNNRTFDNILHLEDNALFPWKGQKFTIRSVNKDGSIKGSDGTSTTWYYYQLLIDLIRNNKVKSNNDFIDFHEYCFQSEMNQLNSKMSHLIKKNDPIRIKSIKERQELFSSNFFRKFNIVILACGHYQRDFDFDIENTFKVRWSGETHTVCTGNWYNIHYDNPKNPTRIVVHTRQFSTGISKELIQEIAEKCRKFID